MPALAIAVVFTRITVTVYIVNIPVFSHLPVTISFMKHPLGHRHIFGEGFWAMILFRALQGFTAKY